MSSPCSSISARIAAIASSDTSTGCTTPPSRKYRPSCLNRRSSSGLIELRTPTHPGTSPASAGSYEPPITSRSLVVGRNRARSSIGPTNHAEPKPTASASVTSTNCVRRPKPALIRLGTSVQRPAPKMIVTGTVIIEVMMPGSRSRKIGATTIAATNPSTTDGRDAMSSIAGFTDRRTPGERNSLV
ncbi:MAG: hypothetical protein HND58_09335 [Planctomycetota bacterium]|nr:MAG: hypothetical protein HND58_09335 [Planctomycetota bacterium]